MSVKPFFKPSGLFVWCNPAVSQRRPTIGCICRASVSDAGIDAVGTIRVRFVAGATKKSS